MLPTRDFKRKDTQRMKVRGQKKIFHGNGNEEKDGIAILISDKIDFETKTVIKDKEGHYIMIKGSVKQEDIFINVYAPNIGAPTYIKQILLGLKGETESNTKIVWEINTPLISMNRASRQKINKRKYWP